MKRKKLGVIILIVFFLGLSYLLWDYLTVDRCLDNGGKWDKSKNVCIGSLGNKTFAKAVAGDAVENAGRIAAERPLENVLRSNMGAPATKGVGSTNGGTGKTSDGKGS